VFAEEARKVLASLERAVGETRRTADGHPQPRIGSLTHLPLDQLQRFLDVLHRRAPTARPEVMHLGTVEQLLRLRDGRLELGILSDVQGFDFEGIEVEPLFDGTEMVALVSERHPAAAKERVGPDDLDEDALVLFPRATNQPLHDWLLERIAEAGYRFRGVHEVSGPDPRDIVLAVAEEAGFALAPVVYEDGWARGIVARRPLETPVSMPQTVLGWRADPPERLRRFVDDARQAARALRVTH
jgi:LysR substrate binding domain